MTVTVLVCRRNHPPEGLLKVLLWTKRGGPLDRFGEHIVLVNESFLGSESGSTHPSVTCSTAVFGQRGTRHKGSQNSVTL